MISVDQALEHVLAHSAPHAPSTTLLTDALGRILAEDVVSDVDSPPHDKSLVDGYAVRAEDLAESECKLRIVEEVMAGEVPTREVVPPTRS